MGLTSALSTALTGMTAAETTIDVVGNNLANANTVGFKASEASFATQFLQTQSLGSAPTATSGGTNPRQTGLGTMVANVTPNFSQGTIQISSSSTDFAIQGDGFFIVRSLSGEVGYTRNGIFKMNSDNELVTITGNRLLGYTINDQYEIQTTSLEPITIPVGRASAAKATENISFEGTLRPSTNVADAAKIIQTDTLYDGNYTAPVGQPDTAQIGGPLTQTYTYYLTYYDSVSSVESRPGAEIGPISLANGSVQFSDFPIPDPTEGWDTIRLYRNAPDTEAGNDRYFLVTELAAVAGATYTDNTLDTALYTDESTHTQEIDFVGPQIDENTTLLDLVDYEGTHYFSDEGVLHFSAKKGGSNLYGNGVTKDFTVTATTTLGDFIEFVSAATGIQSGQGIPDSLDLIHTSNPPIPPGGRITSDNRIQFISNNGFVNGVSIGISDLTYQTDAGLATVEMPFSTYQEAQGEYVRATCVVYDSLGIPCNVTFNAVLQSTDDTATTYRWFADSRDNQAAGGAPNIAVGTGLISFDGEGNMIVASDNDIAIYRADLPSTSPLTCTLDFTALSGLAADSSSWAAYKQDGFGPGSLTNFTVDENGLVRGVFSNGVTRDLGQIRLTRFTNPAGLEQKGQNMFVGGVNAGLPLEGNPGERGLGSIISGAIELSNADIGANLIDLITASTMYRSNTRVITTAQQMLDELLTLQR